MARGVVPGPGREERNGGRRLPRRHQGQAMGNAREGPIARRRGAAEVRLRVAVAVRRHEDDVVRAEGLRKRGRQRAAVAGERPFALRPGEEVPRVVGIAECEHHSQDRATLLEQADG